MGADLARRLRSSGARGLVVAGAGALALAGCTSEPATEGVSSTPSSSSASTDPGAPATGSSQTPGTAPGPAPATSSPAPGDAPAPAPEPAEPDGPAGPTGGDDAAPPPGAPSDLAAVTPVISSAAARGRTVTVDALVPGVVEADGSCTASVSVDGISAEAGGPALADATSTICGELSVDASGLPAGTASVVVLYLSGASQGTSATAEVELS